jgi:hypothetical protein
VIVCAMHTASTNITFSSPTNGFTIGVQEQSHFETAGSFVALYKIVTATSTYSTGVTASSSTAYADIIEAYKSQ